MMSKAMMITLTCLLGIAITFLHKCGEATIVSGNTLIWRFTARDFMPAACHRSFDNLTALWDYSANLSTDNPYNFSDHAFALYREYPDFASESGDRWRGNDSLYCPLWNDIAEGRLNGHPDFEPAINIYSEGCSGFNDFLTSPENGGISCLSLDPSGRPWSNLSKIIEDYLEIDESGIPKPVYCTDPPFSAYGDKRCGRRVSNNILPKLSTTSGPEQFNMWYRDNPEYNMRVGFPLSLTLSEELGYYTFSAYRPSNEELEQGFPANLSFHPMNQYARNVYPCLATDMRLDCSNGGRIFPLSHLATGNELLINASFSFTVEAHFFFDFEGNETFTFQGDDDFWVFINGKLAVDVGGLHGPIRSRIDLSKPAVQQVLGIVPGNPYSVDIFHAERHTSLSNFHVETTFRPKCNVVQAGQEAYAFNASTATQHWKFVGGPTWSLADMTNGGSILLTNADDRNTVAYAFLRQQINVGTGFVAEFDFSIGAGEKAEGFVFVIQRDSISNRNGGSGGHLGFRNTQDSIGVVFDLCADRNVHPDSPTCQLQEVRLHAAQFNNASSVTKKLRAPLFYPNNLNDGKRHRVTVRYFATPAWFEVIIDDDLYLQRRDVALDELGGRNAFVGFTSSTGPETGATLRIWNFNVRTVAVRNSNSRLIPPPQLNVSVIGDGRRTYQAHIATFDFCDKKIEFGGLGSRAGAILVNPSTPEITIPTKALIDNDTGIYTAEFSYAGNGTFDLIAWFGEEDSCSASSSPSETCFKAKLMNAVTFVPPDSAAMPQGAAAISLQTRLWMGFGITAGVIMLVGVCAILYVLPARRQWLRDKKYIEAGRLAALEKGVEYEGDLQIEMMAQRFQRVLEEISKARANKSLQREAEELLRERGEIEETIRMLKAHKLELMRTQGSSRRLLDAAQSSAPSSNADPSEAPLKPKGSARALVSFFA